MAEATAGTGQREDVPAPREIRWLTPENTELFEGTFSLLHCRVQGDTLYRGAFAVPLFPISHPGRYISLRHTDAEETVREIGIIEDLRAFPEGARSLVCSSLARQHHEQTILRIHNVRVKYGVLFFDVETQRGREQFMTPWRRDRADDYSDNGRLILDFYDNRYIVPDLADLPPTDRRKLVRYIYW
jgi:hypothetical protein